MFMRTDRKKLKRDRRSLFCCQQVRPPALKMARKQLKRYRSVWVSRLQPIQICRLGQLKLIASIELDNEDDNDGTKLSSSFGIR